jgi:hypothetical protein
MAAGPALARPLLIPSAIGEIPTCFHSRLKAAAAHRPVTVTWRRQALRSVRNPLRVGHLTGRLLSTLADLKHGNDAS